MIVTQHSPGFPRALTATRMARLMRLVLGTGAEPAAAFAMTHACALGGASAGHYWFGVRRALIAQRLRLGPAAPRTAPLMVPLMVPVAGCGDPSSIIGRPAAP